MSDDPHNFYLNDQINWYFQFQTETSPDDPEQGITLLKDVLARIQEIYRNNNGYPENPETEPVFNIGYGGLPDIIQGSEVYIWHSKINVTNITRDNAKAVIAVMNSMANDEEIGSLINNIVISPPIPGILGRASQGGSWGGGGPGGFPIPPSVSIPDLGLQNSAAPYYFNLPTDLDTLRSGLQPGAAIGTPLAAGAGGANAIVVIIDTCPSDSAWKAAKTQYGATHPILKGLMQLEASNKFFLVNTGPATLQQYQQNTIDKEMAKYGLQSYSMVDHGIFVAGIIHSIAPNATIYLYRAIDDNGVLLIDAAEAALNFATDIHSRSGNAALPLIVNCSLTFMMPTEERVVDRSDPNKSWIEDAWFGRMDKALVVAAAGNEATYVAGPAAGLPPYPRFPSGFESTLGVSSFDSSGNRSNFANWADDFNLSAERVATTPPLAPDPEANPIARHGIAAIGGKILQLANARISDPSDSILGLYISKEFPLLFQTSGAATGYTAIQNTQGWAKWSGTSFSTAIVTGCLALIASDAQANGRSTHRQDLIAELLGKCINAGVAVRLSDEFSIVGSGVAAAFTPTEHKLEVKQG